MSSAANKTQFSKKPEHTHVLVDPEGPFGIGWRERVQVSQKKILTDGAKSPADGYTYPLRWHKTRKCWVHALPSDSPGLCSLPEWLDSELWAKVTDRSICLGVIYKLKTYDGKVLTKAQAIAVQAKYKPLSSEEVRQCRGR